jgi:PKD repeat protein
MSASVIIWKTLAVSFTLALVVIFLRGDLVMEVRGEVDLPPIADAGPDQEVTGPTQVLFDGTGSSDDFEIANYSWSLTYDDTNTTLEGQRPVFFFAIHGVYEVSLQVTDANGSTDTDTVNITVITVPGEIMRVTVIGRNSWVEIDWDEPVHDGGSPVVGCIVYRGTSPHKLEPYYSDWWIRYWSWDYLATNSITYYYAVAALNDAGMGPLSVIVNATPMAVPDSPQNLTVEVVDGAVHLEWDEPLWTDGRVNVTGYQVHRGTDPEWLYDTFLVGLNTSFVDEDVEEGVKYYYVVGADSSFGGSSVTEVLNVTVGDSPEEDENPESWEIALSFALMGGLAVLLWFILRMERNIGKREQS